MQSGKPLRALRQDVPELLPADLEWRQYFDFKPLWTAQKESGLKEDPPAKEVG